MTEDELISAIQTRIVNPGLRTDEKADQATPLCAPATIEALEAAQAELGLVLPPFLRRLYLEIANGGYGPGSGMLGIQRGYVDIDGMSLVGRYTEFRSYGWPRELLPLWDWGGGAWICVDASSDDERIVTHDASGPTPTKFTLRSWLESWVAGVNLWDEVYEMDTATIINPFTRKPMTVKRRVRAKGQ